MLNRVCAAELGLWGQELAESRRAPGSCFKHGVWVLSHGSPIGAFAEQISAPLLLGLPEGPSCLWLLPSCSYLVQEAAFLFPLSPPLSGLDLSKLHENPPVGLPPSMAIFRAHPPTFPLS